MTTTLNRLPISWWYAAVAFVVTLMAGTVVVSLRSDAHKISGQSCHRWVTDCAQHKSLAECRMDARMLGCSEGSVP